MSKIFSLVTLTAENGDTCEFYASGIPQDCDDLADNEQYCDFIESLGGQRVSAEIRAYSYGEGESECAGEDDLRHVAEHFEEMYQRDEIDWLQDAVFCLDVEQEQTVELEDDELEP